MTNSLKLVKLSLKCHDNGSVGIECRDQSLQVQACKGKCALCVCQKGLCLRSGTMAHDTYSQRLGRFPLCEKVKVF